MFPIPATSCCRCKRLGQRQLRGPASRATHGLEVRRPLEDVGAEPADGVVAQLENRAVPLRGLELR